MDLWQPLGTVLLSGVGAFLASFAAKWVESWSRGGQRIEAQRDADLAAILESIRKLVVLAEEFWTNSAEALGPRDATIQAHMVAVQHNLAELIAVLYTGSDKWDCDICFHKLAIAATGGSYGDPERTAEPEHLAEILIASYSLERQVQKARRNLRRRFMA
jgi:hypothetical protein